MEKKEVEQKEKPNDKKAEKMIYVNKDIKIQWVFF